MNGRTPSGRLPTWWPHLGDAWNPNLDRCTSPDNTSLVLPNSTEDSTHRDGEEMRCRCS
jgi:hypothetical protein